jgi:hypothetical protein
MAKPRDAKKAQLERRRRGLSRNTWFQRGILELALVNDDEEGWLKVDEEGYPETQADAELQGPVAASDLGLEEGQLSKLALLERDEEN